MAQISTIRANIPAGKESDAASVIDTLIETLGKLGSGGLEIVKQFFQLPLSAPTMAAVLGILVNDIMAHKVNFISWTHEEQQCLDCGGVLISIYDWITGAHSTHNYQTVTLPGLITGAANLQIAAVILAGFGISAAGEILGDITKITNVTGSQQAQPSITQPSVTTLVTGVPVTIGKEKVS